ncbi:hypothetical protein K457DRAFT_16089 [Linnemannia elongata AG-77]|uniref:Extracellular membrane protein CFEM domain-containing protein n=1 Tax=Linnemannia elongata AG-77 TaxID=1314771 RepID=A0A197K5R4_9FUNG|nr:hypothetical protein K457DRAFT_16089 [Linnemannia elongata AG-77]
MKPIQLAAVMMTLVAASSDTAMADMSVVVKSCTKTVVVQGPECENNNHLDKGVALCVSVNVNTAAAIAIANNDDPSSSPSLDSSSTQEIINSSGSPSLLAKPLSADSTTIVPPPPPSPIPASPKSGTVIVVHDSSAPASIMASGLALVMGVVASILVLL